MSDKKMINFRCREDEVILIDKYAKQQGITRSDYIKQAINKALENSKKGTPVDLSNRQRRGEAIKTPAKCPFNESPAKCVNAVWSILPTRVQQCQTCGIRKRPS